MSQNIEQLSDYDLIRILVFPTDWQKEKVNEAITEFERRKILKSDSKIQALAFCRTRLKELKSKDVPPESLIFTEEELKIIQAEIIEDEIERLKNSSDNFSNYGG